MSACPKCGEDELIMSFKSYNAYNGNISYWGVKCESCGFTVRSEKSIDHARFLWDHAGNPNALKPCPFCGGNVELNHYVLKGSDWWYVACKTCQIAMDPLYWNNEQTKAEAIEKWNRRVNE